MKRLALTSFGVLLVIMLFAQHVGATVIDFEDLTLGASYNVGDSFTTSGVVITGEEFFFLPSGSTTDGSVMIGSGGRADGAGNELAITNINLDFDFGTPLYGLALQYGEYGGNINIEVNGDFANVENFTDIPTTLGGISIFVVDTGDTGALFLVDGSINSFMLGGQELYIDNVVASVVPEPATIALLGIGGLVILIRKGK